MRKWRYLLVFFLLGLLFSQPVSAKEEMNSWRAIVQEMQNRIEEDSLGEDFSLVFDYCSFDPTPGLPLSLKYTLRGDGKVSLQIDNKKRELRISSKEIIELCRSLLEYKLLNLADFVETDYLRSEQPSCSITLRIGKEEKEISFFLPAREKNREIIWQYLYRFGQLLLEKTELRNKNQPILPICKGIIREEKIDSNQDGLIDWLHIWVGFHTFKPNNFIVDYTLGRKQKIFFRQGDTQKEFFINAYVLRQWEEGERGYMTISYQTVKGFEENYVFSLESAKYKKEQFRTKSDIVFKGEGKWRFKVNLDQTVGLRMKSSSPPANETYWWFYIEEISPEEVKLGGGLDSTVRLGGESENLGFVGILSNPFRLLEINSNGAIFEIGWNVSDLGGEKHKIMMDLMEKDIKSGKYKGSKKEEGAKKYLTMIEQLKSQKEKLDTNKLEIDINYSAPPVEKIK